MEQYTNAGGLGATKSQNMNATRNQPQFTPNSLPPLPSTPLPIFFDGLPSIDQYVSGNQGLGPTLDSLSYTQGMQ